MGAGASINPRKGRLAEIAERIPADQPVVMINLLRFRDRADYGDGSISCTGREAYQRYIDGMRGKLAEVGGTLIWKGSAYGCLIAPDGESWDEALLFQYPSYAAFRKMITNREYFEIAKHRTAALEDSRLIASIGSFRAR